MTETALPADLADPADIAEPSPLRPRSVDLWLVGIAALVIRIPAYFASVHLTFDDGVYGASAVAMRHGGVPFKTIFSSQGPLWLPVLWVGDLLGGRTLDSPRLINVLSGVVIALATYVAALRLSDRRGALVAGAIVATSGCVAWISAPAAADGPAIAFTMVAIAVAIRHRDRPTTWRAALIGLLMGAALSVKALQAHALVPIGLVFVAPLWSGLRQRRVDVPALVRAAVAGVCAVGVFVASAVPFGWSRVWFQAVTYHGRAAYEKKPIANAGKIISTLWDRDLVLLLVAAVTVFVAVAARRGTHRPDDEDDRPPRDDRSWWSAATTDPGQWLPSNRLFALSWALATWLWLVIAVNPMWRSHIATVVIPVALLLAIYRPPLRVLRLVAVVAVALTPLQLKELLWTSGYGPDNAETVALLERLPRGAWAISDEPGHVWRAGLQTKDELVDTSKLRVEQHLYDGGTIAHAAADPRVCAVVVTSIERFGAFPELPARLEAEGYQVVRRWGPVQRIYERTDCSPPKSDS